MNEIDFIRQQLLIERVHLRDILEAVRAAAPTTRDAHPVTLYLEWARPRLLAQLEAHRAALSSMPGLEADTAAPLAHLAAAITRVIQSDPGTPTLLADPLLALLDTWSEPLDALAGRNLRVAHWRTATHLSADSIFEERQRYAAARTAVGLK